MTIAAGAERAVTDDELARHFPLVGFVLRQMRARGQLADHLEHEDVEAVGRFAVWQALRRWDASKGTQSTYLSSYIWGYVMRYQRDTSKADGWHRAHGRIARIASLDAPVSASGQTLLDLVAERGRLDAGAHAALRLLDAAADLPARERVVAAHLLTDTPAADVAARLDVSRAQVGRIASRVRRALADVVA